SAQRGFEAGRPRTSLLVRCRIYRRQRPPAQARLTIYRRAGCVDARAFCVSIYGLGRGPALSPSSGILDFKTRTTMHHLVMLFANVDPLYVLSGVLVGAL